MVYGKSHPLRLVNDLQRNIVNNGGTVQRDSDLLAYFEKRSYNPELDPFEILDNLAWSNGIWVSDNHAKTKNLLDCELLAYTSGEGEDIFDRMIRTQRIKKGTGIFPGYSHKIPSSEQARFEKGGYFLSDNEYVLKRNEIARVITLNPKYKEIFPLIINRNENWPHQTKKISQIVIAALILSLSIIVSSFILSQSFRYEVDSFIRIDKWTGKYKIIEIEK